jgi:hypothetical protein
VRFCGIVSLHNAEKYSTGDAGSMEKWEDKMRGRGGDILDGSEMAAEAQRHGEGKNED